MVGAHTRACTANGDHVPNMIDAFLLPVCKATVLPGDGPVICCGGPTLVCHRLMLVICLICLLNVFEAADSRKLHCSGGSYN